MWRAPGVDPKDVRRICPHGTATLRQAELGLQNGAPGSRLQTGVTGVAAVGKRNSGVSA